MYKECLSRRSIKDDRDIKSRLLTAMINFKSFHVKKDCDLHNEFAAGRNNFNKGILKENWIPTAQFLIQRYVTSTSDQPICNFKTIQALEDTLNLSQVAKEILNKVKKSKSMVIDIKPTYREEKSTATATSNSIKCKTEAFQDDLLWEALPFLQAAAICHHDGTKAYPSKAKFRSAVIKHFSKVKTSKTKEDNSEPDLPQRSCFQGLKDHQKAKLLANKRERCILGDIATAWINDAQLANAVFLLKSQCSTVCCQLMYPLPQSSVEKIMSGERRSKALTKVFDEKLSCVVPFSNGRHWRVMLIDAQNCTVYHFDSLGGCIPSTVKEAMGNVVPSS